MDAELMKGEGKRERGRLTDSPPCITARRGGCVINIDREATKANADGVVFRLITVASDQEHKSILV
jgi:hypothetical protein